MGSLVSLSGSIAKKTTITQSTKLIVAVREIFLNDEHDVSYAKDILNIYIKNIGELEALLVDYKLKIANLVDEEKTNVKKQIKNVQKTLEVMNIAKKSLLKFISSFTVGLQID